MFMLNTKLKFIFKICTSTYFFVISEYVSNHVDSSELWHVLYVLYVYNNIVCIGFMNNGLHVYSNIDIHPTYK